MPRKLKPIAKFNRRIQLKSKVTPNSHLEPLIKPKNRNYDHVSRSKNGRLMKKNKIKKTINT